jgi:predicted HD superfamily hydrolase involved in NAD metabolism
VTHPVLIAAAAGELPSWAEATSERRMHMSRVADLMEEWARALGQDEDDIIRWRAAAMLHDALRDADPEALRSTAPPELSDAPAELLHGPAAAARLREEGVRDEAVLRAVAWHTVGHPDLDDLGRALYMADYLEPGRASESPRIVALRRRVPQGLERVLQELTGERIARLVANRQPLLDSTVRFWNALGRG